MQRTLLGLISLGCFAVAVVLYARGDAADTAFAMATSVRIGMITAAWWLAFPSFANMPRWVMVVTGVLALIVAVRPRLIPLAVLAIIAYGLLKPRVKQLAKAVADEQRKQ
jgi:hypothetical protein